MSGAATFRRLTIFGAVLGGGLGVLALLGDGPVRGAGSGGGTRPDLPDEPVVAVADGASMGSGRGVRISKNALAAVPGLPEPVSYRVFEAEWAKQTPLAGGTLEARRLRTTDFGALFFHIRPTTEEPRPPAIEGPGTTRVDAAEADLETDSGTAVHADLRRNVVVVRHDADGDLTLRTDRLTLDFDTSGQGAKELFATTDAPVNVVGRGLTIDAVGLDADLGRAGAPAQPRERAAPESPPARLVFARNVVCTFEAALLPRGRGGDTAAPRGTVTCSGPAELVQLVEPAPRRPGRWRATFQGDVVVRQGTVSMTSQTLEIEVEEAPLRDALPLRTIHVIADGAVRFEGRGTDGSAWSLATPRAETRETPKGGAQTDLIGGVELAFDGSLSGRATSGTRKDALERGRVEVRCAGPATLTTDDAPIPGSERVRGRIRFRDDVVATQWSGDAIHTRVTAPEIVLAGEWVDDAVSDGRLDPETLTATGTPEKRVHIERRQDLQLTAQSQTLTWRVLRETNIEKLLLGGRPAISLVDRSGVNLAGGGTKGRPGTVYIDARDHIELQWWHEEPPADAPEQPLATAQAAGDVVVRGVVDEKETYRLSADRVDLGFDAARELRGLRAYQRVELRGVGDGEGAPHVFLRGDRLAADRDPSVGDLDRVRTDVQVFGDARRPAEARIEETSGGRRGRQDQPGRLEHIVRGEHLIHGAGGTRIEARRSAHVTIDADPQAAATAQAIAPGPIRIDAQLLVIHLDPTAVRDSRDGDLRRVEASGGVTVSAPSYEVTGQTVEYDHVARRAVARGNPARAKLIRPDGLGGFVNSDEITVFMQPDRADPTGRKLSVSRVTCQGGMAQYYLDADEPGTPGTRVTIRASGPIEILPESGSAQGNVEITTFDILPSGSPRRTADVLADRVDLQFDAQREGGARDRLERATAVGTPTRPVQMRSPSLDATADRAELAGSWIELTAPWGNPVHVVQKLPSASEFICDKGRFNPRTAEFKATRSRAAMGGR